MGEGDHQERRLAGEGLAPHAHVWTNGTPALSAESSPGGHTRCVSSTTDFSLPSHAGLPPQRGGAPV